MRVSFAVGCWLLVVGSLNASNPQTPKPPNLQTPFEKIALIDNLDFGRIYDIETEKGTREMIEHICLSHPTALAMRDTTGGLPRFATKEEVGIPCEQPFDEKRICREDPWGWLKLDRDDFDAMTVAFDMADRRGMTRAIHATFEETHWCLNMLSPWVLAHPQYWCRSKGGKPWAAHASLAFPEVRAHKMRYLDELLATKPKTIFLDFCRDGAWHPGVEYVRPVLERWHAKYGAEPPPASSDPRWRALVAEDIMGYLRDYGRKCHAAGCQFILGCQHFTRNSRNADVFWTTHAIDWRALAKERSIDGLVVMSVSFDRKDPYGDTKKTLEYLKKEVGPAKLYFSVSMYNYSHAGVPEYVKLTKDTNGVVAKKLLTMAKEVGCAGVVMEVVDYRNYTPDVNDALKEF